MSQAVRTLSPSFSVCSARNARPYMEDRFAINTTMVLYNYDHPHWQGVNGLFLICDGHAGSACAEFMVNGFMMLFPLMATSEWTMQAVIKRTIQDLTTRWEQTHPDDRSGCTFVALLVNFNSARACTINIGDSRLMQFDEQGEVIFTTKQHDLEDPVERAAIESRFLKSTGARCAVIPDAHGTLRVGGLNMARALGDRGSYINGCISSTPDITELELSHASETTFVMASDGLWDEHAIPVGAYVRQQGSAQDIVRDVTLMQHSRVKDNVTVMMIQFRPQHQQRPFQTISGVPDRNAQQQQQQAYHIDPAPSHHQSHEVQRHLSTQTRHQHAHHDESSLIPSRSRQSAVDRMAALVMASRERETRAPHQSHKRKQTQSNSKAFTHTSSSRRRGHSVKAAKAHERNHVAAKRDYISNSNSTNTESEENNDSPPPLQHVDVATGLTVQSSSNEEEEEEEEEGEEEEEEETNRMHELEDTYFDRIPTFHPHAQNTTPAEELATEHLISSDRQARQARTTAAAKNTSRPRSHKKLAWPNQSTSPEQHQRPLTETRVYEVEENTHRKKVVRKPRVGRVFQGLPPRTSAHKQAIYAPE